MLEILNKELNSIWNSLPKWKQSFYRGQINNLIKCIERDKKEST